MPNTFSNTGSMIGGHSGSGTLTQNAINTTLSTQIVIKVDDVAVGALQSVVINQNRALARIKEIGTDGVIEIVPVGATEFDLAITRIVFDQLRLPEAFKRGFRFINAQRLPFDILVIDLSGTIPNVGLTTGDAGVAVTFKNCWFTSYSTPFNAGEYLISETGNIQCETAFISYPSDPGGNSIPNGGGLRGILPQTDGAGIEAAVNWGGNRRGALDAAGLINSVFSE